jgi:hypothetical protein
LHHALKKNIVFNLFKISTTKQGSTKKPNKCKSYKEEIVCKEKFANAMKEE